MQIHNIEDLPSLTVILILLDIIMKVVIQIGLLINIFMKMVNVSDENRSNLTVTDR